MPPLTGRLCRQTQAASLGQILIVLNRWDATANDRRSIPLKSRTYVDVAAGDKRLPQRQAIGMCSCWRRVSDLLEQQGHKVFTPTLTGVGERSHLMSKDINLNTHITDIVNVVK